MHGYFLARKFLELGSVSLARHFDKHFLVPFLNLVLGGSEDDARSACPSDALGYTHNTMVTTTGRDAVRLS